MNASAPPLKIQWLAYFLLWQVMSCRWNLPVTVAIRSCWRQCCTSSRWRHRWPCTSSWRNRHREPAARCQCTCCRNSACPPDYLSSSGCFPRWTETGNRDVPLFREEPIRLCSSPPSACRTSPTSTWIELNLVCSTGAADYSSDPPVTVLVLRPWFVLSTAFGISYQVVETIRSSWSKIWEIRNE